MNAVIQLTPYPQAGHYRATRAQSRFRHIFLSHRFLSCFHYLDRNTQHSGGRNQLSQLTYCCSVLNICFCLTILSQTHRLFVYLNINYDEVGEKKFVSLFLFLGFTPLFFKGLIRYQDRCVCRLKSLFVSPLVNVSHIWQRKMNHLESHLSVKCFLACVKHQ